MYLPIIVYKTNMVQFFGLGSGFLTGISYIPYIRDILLRKTKPERASWLIWSLLGGIAFFTQTAEGAGWSLWLTGIDTLGVFFIFLLSLKYGVGGWTRRDLFALFAAGAGLLLWFFTQQAFLALFIIIAVDAIGTSLTVIKTYKNPESETFSAWCIMAIAALLGVFSVGEFNPVLLSYPVYIVLANAAVILAIIVGRNKRHQ